MTRPVQDQYPHDLAGGPASPPQTPPADLVQAWREYEAEELAELGEELLSAVAGNWRSAACLDVLLAEADAANPRRDRRSDGGLGDARHRGQGKASDHNPWVIVAGVGVFRARDFDTDGLDVAGAFERMRRLAHAGKLPQLTPGGYLIYAGRITAPDFSEWREYTGPNPHVTHGHVSASLLAERFDDRRPWNVWTVAATPATRPTKPAPATPAAPARDLRGRGFDLRGEQGAAGPRVAALQRFLRTWYPLYAQGLADDSHWGPRTSAVLRQFAHRSRIPSADGTNIGPRLARALHLAGFRG